MVIRHGHRPLLITVADGSIALSNPAAQALFGYAEDEFKGRPVVTLIPGRYRDRFRRALAACAGASGKRTQRKVGALHGLRRDGSEFTADVNLKPLGERQTLVQVRAIIERRHVEIALRASELEAARLLHSLEAYQVELEQQNEELRLSRAEAESARRRYAMLYDFAPVGYFMLDSAGRIAQVNLIGAELLGLPRSRITGQPFTRFVAVDDRAAFQQFLAGVKAVDLEQKCDLALQRADSTRLYARIEAKSSESEEEVLTVVLDITERKQARLALAESEAQYRAVVETAADGFWMVDGQGRLLAVNDAYVRRSGYSRQELLTMQITDLEAQESSKQARAHIAKIRQQGSDLFETRHRTKDGEVWPAEVNAAYWEAAGGRFFAFLRDITERKRVQKELEGLQAEMEQVMRFHVASQTITAIGHELHQPLNAITFYAEAALRLLRAGNPQPDKLRHALESGAFQAQRAGRVVRELMEWIGKGEVRTEPLDLNDLVRKVLARMEAEAQGGFLTRLDLEAGLGLVKANRLQVEKVLINLIENGVEAMREGGASPASITVTVSTHKDGSMAQVTVRDSGPGIDAQTLHRIFDPFFSAKPNGLGMGLAISRAIVEAHGGRLWAESAPGSGASFHFTLPFAP